MDTNKLKKFAQSARRRLRNQVAARIEHVLKVDSVEHREKEKVVKELEDRIAKTSKERVIDQVAYTWFNRLCALRFMDVNRYTPIGTVSPVEGHTQPEILAEAKQGHIDEDLSRFLDKKRVFDLLSGSIPSSDPQSEVYRILLVAVCNYFHASMPFLFERIDDYTELLMPDDLLSENSLLAELREAMMADTCGDVEVIGWLYQFYISEKKDEVFEGLKKNKKVTPENIPAATQLFTPNWIVRYLVENSLGRLWVLNRPQSRLIEQMEYYIKPDETETDFLQVSSPEEIKVCDPACGSGHMLVYAFELLYAIYEEEGYEQSEIPSLILKNNLYGIEIDGRAGELAAFALVMKAREKYRRFLNKPIQPRICVLENVSFEEDELDALKQALGHDLFTVDLKTTLRQFEEADNFGSLIRSDLEDVEEYRQHVREIDPSGDFSLYQARQKAMIALRQADYLSPKYHVVIANPPYMGGKGMNARLGSWAKDNYPETKSDLFAMFIERGLNLTRKNGYNSMVTMEAWMFISTYENFRLDLLGSRTILSMVHMPYLGKGGTSMGINFGTAATIFYNSLQEEHKGDYYCVRYFETDEDGVPQMFPLHNERQSKTSASDFRKIPGSPIAYWISDSFRDLFLNANSIGIRAVKGLDTGGNIELFLNRWYEINKSDFSVFNPKSDIWYPIAKGGSYKKWYGNHEYVINYKNNGEALKKNRANLRNKDKYFERGLSWTVVSSRGFAVRYLPEGFLFDQGGSGIFLNCGDIFSIESILSSLNSKVTKEIATILCPTLNFTTGDVRKFPVWNDIHLSENAKKCIAIAKEDWDSYEQSWDFSRLPLLRSEYKGLKLNEAYNNLQKYKKRKILELRQIEEENNAIIIEQNNLKDDLDPSTSLDEITNEGNPFYRYTSKKSEKDLEIMQLKDSMQELISYAVGCIFGRYSTDKKGLILASQGDCVSDYLKMIPNPTIRPEESNVIPILDDDWFADDITEKFKQFLRVTFGEQHFQENLTFIEHAIGKDIRKFFLKDFYNDHIKRYKKRPIYWMFSSPKGSFNALIYMHRYQPDTVSVVLNDYLREYRTKLTARREHLEKVSISTSASNQEKTRALKEIDKLKKIINELNDYERDILYPLATEKIEIDLDDGVKVNYNKFGKALKKVSGLST